jgi:hypothetical protein
VQQYNSREYARARTHVRHKYLRSFVCIDQELFRLLTDDSVEVPLGKTAARMLAVELAAGGVSPEHTDYVSGHLSDTLRFIIIVLLLV